MFSLDAPSTLFDRYPEIALLLSDSNSVPFTRYISSDLSANAVRNEKKATFNLHRPEGINEEMAAFHASLPLDNIDVLVIFGLGMGHAYRTLRTWLHTRPERVLIFVEQDLAVLELLAKSQDAEDLFQDSQVHLKVALDRSDWRNILDEIPLRFPTERIEMAFLESYYKRWKRKCVVLRLRLLRNATSFNALMCEALHSEKLAANLISNFRRLHECSLVNAWAGKFRGCPAIICGAGPSLKESLPYLKDLKDKALIIAGGSTVAAMTTQGVEPHIAMALDPNPEEYLRFKAHNAFATPFVFSSRLQADVFNTLNGPLGYLRSQTGGDLEQWMEVQLDLQNPPIGPELDREAMTVTTLALALASALGCDPIILTGVDLAYTGNKRYAEGVLQDASIDVKKFHSHKASEALVLRNDRKGNPVWTLVKWIMESASMSKFAQERAHTTFINATEGGIGFNAIAYKSLKQIAQDDLNSFFDISAFVHALFVDSVLDQATDKAVTESLATLKSSLERCAEFSLLLGADNGGKAILYEMEIEQELAFPICIEPVKAAVERMKSWRLHAQSGDDLVSSQRVLSQEVWRYLHRHILKMLTYL